MRLNQRILRKYQDRLLSIPAPGGNGCHPAILGVSNIGVLAGLSPDRIFFDLRHHIPLGRRTVPDTEIWDAINKAFADRGRAVPKLSRPMPKPIPKKNNEDTLLKIIAQGQISDEADLIACSPIPITWPPQEHHVHFLRAMFPNETELLFIGDRDHPGIPGINIKTVAEHLHYLERGGKTQPHIIINPLTGASAPKKSGDGTTYRGENCVSKYHHCLVEFDTRTRTEQIRFWSAVKLPIRALVDTGGKSIHAWIDISKSTTVNTPEQWQSEIKERLYDCLLTPLGVDAACSNASRLSRLPGHFRSEKESWQRLLWLSPEGRRVTP